jgi:hypothetical protein
MSAGKTFPNIPRTKTIRDPQFGNLCSKRTAAELRVSKAMLMEETLSSGRTGSGCHLLPLARS